mgnify:FL=1
MKILYGVAGEGMGHATRAKAVLDKLHEHNVKVITADRAANYLSKWFDVRRIACFKIIYRNNKVSNLGIIVDILLRSPILCISLIKTFLFALRWKPDVIVTDFEPFTCYAGMLLRIPVVSIDNQQLLLRTDAAQKLTWESFKTAFVTKLLVPAANQYVITAFSRPSITKRRTTIVGPIVRKALPAPAQGDHVLVYQTSKSNKRLFRILQSVPAQFIVYGFDREGKEGNIQFKRFHEQKFMQDLASCKAVITNGGYSLMSEALMLGKPVLSEPVGKQFEQQLNALLLEKEGFGQRTEHIGAMQISSFLLKNFKKYAGPTGNNATITAIERA